MTKTTEIKSHEGDPELGSNPLLSVCITTRNRPNEITRCLNSLKALEKIDFEIIVSDDASDTPTFSQIAKSVDIDIWKKAKLIRFEENVGLIAARNELAELSCAPYILSLDDDASIYTPHVILKALEILKNDAEIGAIALTQSNEAGELLHSSRQAAPVDYPCITCSYIGFGHILRKDLFLSLGGYRSIFWYGYEEAEYSKRMLDKGFKVLFLPDVGVIHCHSSIGRSKLRHLRNGCRNKCFSAIYNEPFLMMMVSIPARLILYYLSRGKVYREYAPSNSEDVKWLAVEIFDKLSIVWRDRKPLKWLTYLQWHNIQKRHPAYHPQNFPDT